MKHPEIVNAVCFMHNNKTVLLVLIVCFLRNTRIINKVDPWNYYTSMIDLIPGSSRELTILGDMRQNLKSSNNAAIETKEIREKLMVCFTNKGATSWQRK